MTVAAQIKICKICVTPACILRDRFRWPTEAKFVRHDFLPLLRRTQSKNFDAEIPPPVSAGKQFTNTMLSRSDSRIDNLSVEHSGLETSAPPPSRLFPCLDWYR